MESRSMKRARRTAVAVKDGPEILDYIAAPKSRGLLVSRAERGAPPVGAISESLLREFGRGVKLAPVKQFIGMCVRAVLEEEGYSVAEKGVRIKDDNVFSTGSVYIPTKNKAAKASVGAKAGSGLCHRIRPLAWLPLSTEHTPGCSVELYRKCHGRSPPEGADPTCKRHSSFCSERQIVVTPPAIRISATASASSGVIPRRMAIRLRVIVSPRLRPRWRL